VIVDTITYAKAHFSALIDKILDGEEVVIKKAGKPIAIIQKFDNKAIKRVPGLLKGKIRISDDFDELPEYLQVAFGMK
jgi:antitoxin (DNA-binding transcriptional repressor) of toxin-antitoxin stability system